MTAAGYERLQKNSAGAGFEPGVYARQSTMKEMDEQEAKLPVRTATCDQKQRH